MANVYQAVAQANPGNSLTSLYTVPGGASFVGSLWVGNTSSTGSQTFRMAVSIAGAAVVTSHYLYYDVPVPTNDTLQITGISMRASDILRVYGQSTKVTFNLQGVEIA